MAVGTTLPKLLSSGLEPKSSSSVHSCRLQVELVGWTHNGILDHVPRMQSLVKIYIFSPLVCIISLIMSNCVIIVNTANSILFRGCEITMCNEEDANSLETNLHQDFHFEKFSISTIATDENAHVCFFFVFRLFVFFPWQLKEVADIPWLIKKSVLKVQEFPFICPVFKGSSMISHHKESIRNKTAFLGTILPKI